MAGVELRKRFAAKERAGNFGMSFLYDRTIAISRAASQSGPGLQAYGGDVPGANETAIASGISASIQARRMGQRNDPNLPLDATKGEWRIYFRMAPGFNATLVQDRDFVTDDLGRRFQVAAAYPTPQGFELRCFKMEA
jgi:hypothetical protein